MFKCNVTLDDDMFGEDPYGVMHEMLDERIEEGSKSYINTSNHL